MKPPGKATLRRYGLTESEWLALVPADGLCPICRRPPSNGRWVTDHDHVYRWKHKAPDERKRHVRGTLCTWCNFRLLRKGLTLERARRIVAYLEAYESSKRSAA